MWENDKKNGRGTYSYINGNKYIGMGKNDMAEGNAIY